MNIIYVDNITTSQNCPFVPLCTFLFLFQLLIYSKYLNCNMCFYFRSISICNRYRNMEHLYLKETKTADLQRQQHHKMKYKGWYFSFFLMTNEGSPSWKSFEWMHQRLGKDHGHLYSRNYKRFNKERKKDSRTFQW